MFALTLKVNVYTVTVIGFTTHRDVSAIDIFRLGDIGEPKRKKDRSYVKIFIFMLC